MNSKTSTLFYATNVSIFENKDLYDLSIQSLSETDKNYVEQYKIPYDRYRSLGSKLLLKKALLDFGVDVKNAVFSTNRYGKPYLANIKGIFFNISHSGNIAICAVSEFEVGCDVEKIGSPNDNIARYCFAPLEYGQLMCTKNSEERTILFYRFWTLKESFVKAVGLGLNLPLNDFSINIDGKEPTIYQKADKRIFHLKEFNEIKGYKIALALNGNHEDVQLKIIDLFDNLV